MDKYDEIYEAFYNAVVFAINEVGVEGLKKTSMFGSNDEEGYGG